MPTQHTTVKRHPERGAYDRATIDSILDEALICHLGFVVEGRPFVIPTIHARDREVTDRDEKLRAMQRVVEHVVPGRWNDARRPSDGEIKGTTILALALDEASAKIRSGPPSDDEADKALPIWAGVIPLGIEPA